MKTKFKTTLFAGAASLLMLGGCNESTDRQVPRTADDDGGYRTSQYDDRPTDLDRENGRLPGTFATPREDDRSQDNRLDNDVTIAGDAQALGMLSAIDQHEMHASGDAMVKELSEPVKAYAQMLHEDHGANLEKTNQIIKDLDLTLSIPGKGQSLLDQGKSKVTDWARLSGVEYERAFMAAMVQGHTDALRTIDNELIPAAKNEAVINHLKASRETVAQHLEEAKRVQESLKDRNNANTPAQRNPL